MKGKIFSVLVVMLVMSFLTSCITTNVRGYTDRNYSGYKIKKIAVRAPNSSFVFAELLEKSMIEELNSRGIHAESFLMLFPPTRKWSNKKVSTILMQNGFDSIMYINLIGSRTKTKTTGYDSNGTANVYGTAAFYTDSSTAITTISRFTSTRLKLYETGTARVIWVADSNTKAGGLLFVGIKSQTDSIAEETVEALMDAGHL